MQCQSPSWQFVELGVTHLVAKSLSKDLIRSGQPRSAKERRRMFSFAGRRLALLNVRFSQQADIGDA